MMTSRITFLLLFFALSAGHAQVGSLDDTFSGDGKLMTPVGTGTDIAYGLIVQPDKRIVAVGLTVSGGDNDFAVVRYLEDGTLDNSFDGDGKVIIDFEGGNDEARDVALLANGNILVAGTAKIGTDLDFALVMLDPDGNLVTSFDGDGKLTIDFSNTDDHLYRITLDGDRIYAVGSSVKNDVEEYAIATVNINGTMEDAFSQDGMLVFDVAGGADIARAVALQQDKKIVVAGYTGNQSELDFCVVRFKPDGSLDSGFSEDGIIITDLGTFYDRAFAVAVQDDQKIVVAGSNYGDSGYDFAVVRYLPDGMLDLDFGDDGFAIEGIGPFFDDAQDMILQPDGKILVTGSAAQAATDADFGLARFTTDGILDNTFSQDGKVITIVGSGDSEDEVYAIALQPDGKIVIAGEAQSNSGNVEFALARYISGIPTSVKQEIFTLEELKLFPNPTQESLNASFSLSKDEALEFSITDLSGSIISVIKQSEKFAAGNHTMTANLPASFLPGAYLLCVTDADGKKAFFKFLAM